mmetsp:Transcript_17902/g.41749  ORF Transcript_17902/g.41749 Transcript_17902/m.41749 type:complete len:204 (+) Transcript_17902:87-698(+)
MNSGKVTPHTTVVQANIVGEPVAVAIIDGVASEVAKNSPGYNHAVACFGWFYIVLVAVLPVLWVTFIGVMIASTTYVSGNEDDTAKALVVAIAGVSCAATAAAAGGLMCLVLLCRRDVPSGFELLGDAAAGNPSCCPAAPWLVLAAGGAALFGSALILLTDMADTTHAISLWLQQISGVWGLVFGSIWLICYAKQYNGKCCCC